MRVGGRSKGCVVNAVPPWTFGLVSGVVGHDARFHLRILPLEARSGVRPARHSACAACGENQRQLYVPSAHPCRIKRWKREDQWSGKWLCFKFLQLEKRTNSAFLKRIRPRVYCTARFFMKQESFFTELHTQKNGPGSTQERLQQPRHIQLWGRLSFFDDVMFSVRKWALAHYRRTPSTHGLMSKFDEITLHVMEDENLPDCTSSIKAQLRS